MTALPHKVAVIGAGEIGCGWAALCASAGWPVTVFDASARTVERASVEVPRRARALVALERATQGIVERGLLEFQQGRSLLQAVSAPEAADVDAQKQDLLRVRFEEEARMEVHKTAAAAVAGQPAGGLMPWRQVITPHPDVASGKYQQAEFAADLGQVFRGEGSDEYRDPREFFRRTHMTEGLKQLLSRAVLRISNRGGDPVVELQTNFGGGKTHALLALYHLFSGVPVSELPGIEEVIRLATGERRVLLTEDKDFGQLVFAAGKETCGGIFIRYPAGLRSELPQRVLDAVKRESSRMQTAFVVLQPKRMRISRLPRREPSKPD